MNCPLCGEKMKCQSWAGEFWGARMTDEILRQCPWCGYTYHWCYGYTVIDGIPETPEEIEEYRR